MPPGLAVYPSEGPLNRVYTADARGVCRIPGLPQGCRARIELIEDRYSQLTGNGALDHDLAWRPVTEEKPVVLTPGASIQGRVSEADGKPAARMSVIAAARDAHGNGLGYGTAVSTLDGSYEIRRLRPGPYTVSMWNPLDASARGWTAHSVTGVKLGRGDHRVGINLKLVRGAVISGRVRAVTGEPVAGILLEAKDPDDVWSVGTRTCPGGSYTLRVPSGRQQLYVQMQLPGFKSRDDEDDGHYRGMRAEYQRNLSLKDDEPATVDFRLPHG